MRLNSCMKKLLAVTAFLALLTAPAFAQDAATPPAEDDLTAEDILTVSIGCTATYDIVLAQGKGGDRVEDIKKARAFALSVYKEFSGESDEQLAQTVQSADEVFPEMLKESGATLEEFQETCDAIFVEEETEATPTT